MLKKKELASRAYLEAMKLRVKYNFDYTKVFDIFDFVTESLGLELQFHGITNLEGMYQAEADKSRIFISAHRPYGRQVFTCAHEIGHHIFNHGTKIDEYLDGNTKIYDDDEYLADQFASSLLMPKSLVSYAFKRRGLEPRYSSHLQVFAIANWLGVGYSTLCNQMQKSLGLINENKYKDLKSLTPKAIKQNVLDRSETRPLTIVDFNWIDKAIDVSVGNYVLVPKGTQAEGDCVAIYDESPYGLVFQAVRPGTGKFVNPNCSWSSNLRVSRENYCGWSDFRHLEDEEYDQ